MSMCACTMFYNLQSASLICIFVQIYENTHIVICLINNLTVISMVFVVWFFVKTL